MERQSASGRAGMPIRDFTLEVRESISAWALELDSLAGLAGVGGIGDTAGMALESCLIMAPGRLTAGLSIADFMAAAFMAEDFTAAASMTVVFMETADFMERVDFMAALIQERSVASIMGGWQAASAIVDDQASVGIFMEAEDSTAGAVGAGKFLNFHK
jgi:hypothetical protein